MLAPLPVAARSRPPAALGTEDRPLLLGFPVLEGAQQRPSLCSGSAAHQRDIFGVVTIWSEVVNKLEHWHFHLTQLLKELYSCSQLALKLEAQQGEGMEIREHRTSPDQVWLIVGEQLTLAALPKQGFFWLWLFAMRFPSCCNGKWRPQLGSNSSAPQWDQGRLSVVLGRAGRLWLQWPCPEWCELLRWLESLGGDSGYNLET